MGWAGQPAWGPPPYAACDTSTEEERTIGDGPEAVPATLTLPRGDGRLLSPQTPAGELPFGVAASYWLDLRTDDPPTTAVGLGVPILILQGGRDHQVTIADDLALWRAGLTGHAEVSTRI